MVPNEGSVQTVGKVGRRGRGLALARVGSRACWARKDGLGPALNIGEIGDMPLDVCEPDFNAGFKLRSGSCPSAALRVLAPSSEFFCLNFSSQIGLFTLTWQLGVPTVVAKNLALSRMMSSLKGKPWCW